METTHVHKKVTKIQGSELTIEETVNYRQRVKTQWLTWNSSVPSYVWRFHHLSSCVEELWILLVRSFATVAFAHWVAAWYFVFLMQQLNQVEQGSSVLRVVFLLRMLEWSPNPQETNNNLIDPSQKAWQCFSGVIFYRTGPLFPEEDHREL